MDEDNINFNNVTTTDNEGDATIIDMYPDSEEAAKKEQINKEEELNITKEINEENKEEEERKEIVVDVPKRKKKGKRKKKKKNLSKITITAKEKTSMKEFSYNLLKKIKAKPPRKATSHSSTQKLPQINKSPTPQPSHMRESKSSKQLENKKHSVPRKYKLKPIITNSLKRIKQRQTYEEHLIKIRKLFAEKKYLVPKAKSFTYVIMPGNASYLIKNCFHHRVNWKEAEMKVSSIFNFKWQQTNICIDFGSLSSIEKIPQIVNHFEFHSAISNKTNMFINLFNYCEKNNINVFKYVPFTILVSSTNNNENNFDSFFNKFPDFTTMYDDIANEVLPNKPKKNTKYYSDVFDISIGDTFIGNRTQITIPHTHYAKKNIWVIKASNLNRGQCIRIADNPNKIREIVKEFIQGIKIKNISKENNENNIQISINSNTSSNIPSSDIYKTDKIIIQKYIERPLLYKNRKCDMRIWVLLTHEMKAYVFKEGHLKTCSAEYDLNNNKDAYVHITNYSFQKHAENFQKFEKGNEVSFLEFQKFLEEKHKEKNIDIQRDIMSKVKEIVDVTMKSVKDKINMNKRHFSFEIFGYDFMMDEEFNMFLIEINTNPGIEESSPWIKVIVPRMLDDAIRLTIDKIFPPKYVFDKEIKELVLEECLNDMELKQSVINSLGNSVEIKQEKDKDINAIDLDINDKSEQPQTKNENVVKKPEYISPFPVLGYSNEENLWDFVCDISNEKKNSITMPIGVKGLLLKKKPSSN